MLEIKRVYEEPAENDGTRVLIDRLWPQGLKIRIKRVCNKTYLLKIFNLFLFFGLLIFGAACSEANELYREKYALAEKFAYLQEKTFERVKYCGKEKSR